MKDCYEVYFGNAAAGKVQMIRKGLYYRLICRCSIPVDQICRLYAVWGNERYNLGVVIPDGEGFYLEKMVPVKYIREDGLRFVLSTGCTPLQGKVVPVCPEEPFSYIDRLKTAFLDSEHGKPGIRIMEHPEVL